MSSRPASSAKSASAGGHEEHPCDVNSSTTARGIWRISPASAEADVSIPTKTARAPTRLALNMTRDTMDGAGTPPVKSPWLFVI